MIRPSKSRRLSVRAAPLGPKTLPDGIPAPPYGRFVRGQFVSFSYSFKRECECGRAAFLFCPGDCGCPATNTTEDGIRTVEQPATEPVHAIALCQDCARARGWPNFPSEKSPVRSLTDA